MCAIFLVCKLFFPFISHRLFFLYACCSMSIFFYHSSSVYIYIYIYIYILNFCFYFCLCCVTVLLYCHRLKHTMTVIMYTCMCNCVCNTHRACILCVYVHCIPQTLHHLDMYSPTHCCFRRRCREEDDYCQDQDE